MGIPFARNTWRAPLRLIDSWLALEPVPIVRRERSARIVQLFSRAGWLHAKPSTPAAPSPQLSKQQALSRSNVHRLDKARRQPLLVRQHGQEGRLVISGRMHDVCAELDRLVALESQQHAVKAA